MRDRWLCGTLAGCLLAGAPALAEGAGAEVTWGRNLKAALAESAASGRPALVDVWAIWCVPCKQMDETTYRDPEVVRATASFVPVKVDHDVQELFVERHRVEALPLVLFLDAEGREISRLAGLLSAEELLEAMGHVRDGYASYLEAVERPNDPAALGALGSYLLAAGNPERAAEVLRKAVKGLADGAADREARGRALEALVRAERARDREEAAAQALARLRSEFPERAAALDAE
jgi:thioredoxin-like negative regulator of GroEL